MRIDSIGRHRSELMQARWGEARAVRKVKPWCMWSDVECLKYEAGVTCTSTMMLIVPPDEIERGLCMRHVRLYLQKTGDRFAMMTRPPKETGNG